MKYPRRNYLTNEQIEAALAAIMAALYPNCEEGWNAWSRYAANGEWI
ncbi:hypothetical protein [Bradyrhizobium sp.]|jgi:hypothetical protein|nr:hypothetical protein [Bradyrhizobium sp.]HEV2155425.1 hypothetical protein [Bradyrhizobium sp.]